uniref:glycoside hydrolase family 20 zincin-like fold domain-containing protein n=1 Tax=Segatella baroniae TaxID=305719 RepID=UPI001EE172AB|nr:glycoside hydrolase family 20 zincin-like fold domain-containing protein [Segatella baroniae]
MKRIRTFITLCLLAFGMAAVAQQPALIPVPSSVDWASGTYTLPSKQITIGCGSAQLRPAADYLAALLARPTGCQVKVNDKGKGHIRLSMAGQGVAGGYRLRVDAQGVAITGNDYRGVINGIASCASSSPTTSRPARLSAAANGPCPMSALPTNPASNGAAWNSTARATSSRWTR